jgi:hypothetical protein
MVIECNSFSQFRNEILDGAKSIGVESFVGPFRALGIKLLRRMKTESSGFFFDSLASKRSNSLWLIDSGHFSLGLIDIDRYIDLSPPLQESGINPKFTTVSPL